MKLILSIWTCKLVSLSGFLWNTRKIMWIFSWATINRYFSVKSLLELSREVPEYWVALRHLTTSWLPESYLLRQLKIMLIHEFIRFHSAKIFRDVVQSFGKIRSPLFLSCMDFPNLCKVPTSRAGGCGGRGQTFLCFQSILRYLIQKCYLVFQFSQKYLRTPSLPLSCTDTR